MGIRKVSIKRQAQLDEYKTKRLIYLLEHKDCEVKDCSNAATEIHHKRGRSGEQLNKTEDFMAICRDCHVYIEEHPDWARAKDYTRSRLEI